MYAYFHKTELDSCFFAEHLRARLPQRIIDAHAHFNLPEHVAAISKETIAGDWALECGLLMSYEDAQNYTAVMFPGKSIDFVALPWPLREADTIGNNAYIASLINQKKQRGLYTVRPEYDIRQMERAFIAGGFCGFKPYPYMASAIKGADVSIFDFMPHAQFELANRLHAPVLMHLPRAGRLPDPDNVKEIREILERYPHVKLVIAHFGRCFHHDDFARALKALGDDVHRVWFDTAAVMNPKVYALAKQYLDHRRILFGTDLPIFLWHGKREWDDTGYHNLCREDFSWNKHMYPQDEPGYTYFVYEQMNNILNTWHDPEALLDIFARNAEAVYLRRPCIQRVQYDRARHLNLLLVADPEEAAIAQYIHNCTLYECIDDDQLVGLAAVSVDADGTAELKNISVLVTHCRKGIGSSLIRHMLADALEKRFIVGTADTSEAPLAFYAKNGFVQYGRIADFFITNYAQPVYDQGRQCRDMIMLEWRG